MGKRTILLALALLPCFLFTPVKASADTINYDIDIDTVGNLIDSLCDMANVVNAEPGKDKK